MEKLTDLLVAVQDRLSDAGLPAKIRGASKVADGDVVVETPSLSVSETLDGYRWADAQISIRIHTNHKPSRVNHEPLLILVEQVDAELQGKIDLAGYDAYVAPPEIVYQQYEREGRTALDAVLVYPSIRFPAG